MAEPLIFKGETHDGQQMLVTVFDGEVAEVATRPHEGATWLPPVVLNRSPR